MKSETSFQNLNEHAIDPTDARTRLSEEDLIKSMTLQYRIAEKHIKSLSTRELLNYCGISEESGPTDQQAQDVLVQPQKTGMDQS